MNNLQVILPWTWMVSEACKLNPELYVFFSLSNDIGRFNPQDSFHVRLSHFLLAVIRITYLLTSGRPNEWPPIPKTPANIIPYLLRLRDLRYFYVNRLLSRMDLVSKEHCLWLTRV